MQLKCAKCGARAAYFARRSSLGVRFEFIFFFVVVALFIVTITVFFDVFFFFVAT